MRFLDDVCMRWQTSESPSSRQGAARQRLTYRAIHSESSAMEGSLNSRLSMITLPDVDGKEIRFGSLWVRQPAVVVFLRHYG